MDQALSQKKSVKLTIIAFLCSKLTRFSIRALLLNEDSCKSNSHSLSHPRKAVVVSQGRALVVVDVKAQLPKLQQMQ